MNKKSTIEKLIRQPSTAYFIITLKKLNGIKIVIQAKNKNKLKKANEREFYIIIITEKGIVTQLYNVHIKQ